MLMIFCFFHISKKPFSDSPSSAFTHYSILLLLSFFFSTFVDVLCIWYEFIRWVCAVATRTTRTTTTTTTMMMTVITRKTTSTITDSRKNCDVNRERHWVMRFETDTHCLRHTDLHCNLVNGYPHTIWFVLHLVEFSAIKSEWTNATKHIRNAANQRKKLQFCIAFDLFFLVLQLCRIQLLSTFVLIGVRGIVRFFSKTKNNGEKKNQKTTTWFQLSLGIGQKPSIHSNAHQLQFTDFQWPPITTASIRENWVDLLEMN